MTYHTKTLGFASAVALAIGATVALTPMTANAATLELLDPTEEGLTRTVGNNHDLGVEATSGFRNIAPGMTEAGYEALVPDTTGRIGDTVTFFRNGTKSADNGISVSKDSLVTFTYLGSEAGFTNLAVERLNNSVVFRNKTDNNGPATNFAETFTMRFGPGLIPFLYETGGNGGGTIANDGGASKKTFEIAYGAIFNNDQSVNVFFGDGTGDTDLDDLGMRIDVSPVPLPAAGLLLLGGLGGLGGLSALRRRKRAA